MPAWVQIPSPAYGGDKVKTKKNPRLLELISELKKKSFEERVKIWKDIAERLEKPRSRMSQVNISRVAKYTKEGDIVIVPGKLLGCGEINHAITVGALSFSEKARKKISKAGGECLSIKELMMKYPKGSNVRIIG